MVFFIFSHCRAAYASSVSTVSYEQFEVKSLHLWTRVMNGDFRDFELMSNNDFPQGSSSVQKDMTYGEFKSRTWNVSFDLM